MRSQFALTNEQLAGGESCQHYDIVSLYPFVQKHRPFPVLDCHVISESELVGVTDISKYFGLAKVDVHVSETVLHPVLPYRTRVGRLLFGLFFSAVNCFQRNGNMRGSNFQVAVRDAWKMDWRASVDIPGMSENYMVYLWRGFN